VTNGLLRVTRIIGLNSKLNPNPTLCLRAGLYFFTMWKEGYDYPADEEDEPRDYCEEADEQYDKKKHEKLDQ